MRILLLAQVLPYPPDSGPKIKTYGTIRALTQAHEVTVVAFIRTLAEEAHARELARLGCVVHTVPLRRGRRHEVLAGGYALVTGTSFLIARDRRHAMHRIVRQLLHARSYDAIHVDQVNMAQYVPRRFRGKVVFDAHNAAWMIIARIAEQTRNPLRRFALRRERDRVRRAEGAICRSVDIVLTTTHEDTAALVQASDRPFTNAVIPIGVPVGPVLQGDRTEPMLLHIGTMFYPPNADAMRWFLTEVFGRVRAAVPQARIVIVGSRPPADILALHDPTRGIEVRGYVEDLAPLLATAAAAIVPTRAGSGMRVKILESMAAGLPVVTTTVGAEGIAVTPDTHVLMADTAEDFATATIRALTDANLRAHLCTNAYARVRERYDWQVTGQSLLALYESVSREPATRPASTEGVWYRLSGRVKHL